MSTKSTTTTSSGMSFTSVLGLIFVVLKLCGVINWSWVWVLSPFWIPLCIVFAILAIGIVGMSIASLITALTK